MHSISTWYAACVCFVMLQCDCCVTKSTIIASHKSFLCCYLYQRTKTQVTRAATKSYSKIVSFCCMLLKMLQTVRKQYKAAFVSLQTMIVRCFLFRDVKTFVFNWTYFRVSAIQTWITASAQCLQLSLVPLCIILHLTIEQMVNKNFFSAVVKS